MLKSEISATQKGWTSALLLVVMSTVFLGLTSLMRTQNMTNLPPLVLMALLLFASALISIPVAWSRRAELKQLNSVDVLNIVVTSWSGPVFAIYFSMLALMPNGVPLGNLTGSVIVQKLQPVITFIFAYAMLREKPSIPHYLALFVLLLGSYLTAFGAAPVGNFVEGFNRESLIYMSLSVVFGSLNSVTGKVATTKISPINLAAVRSILAAILSVLITQQLAPKGTDFASMFGSISVDWWRYALIGLANFGCLTIYFYGVKKLPVTSIAIAEFGAKALAPLVIFGPLVIKPSLSSVSGFAAAILAVIIIARTMRPETGHASEPNEAG
ncbi:MAG: hypothetical protein FJ146_15415 [Deltaproteobacteria bacterium]|nr:hypothetical protein [Deltaproteobacteria bacterium]